MILFELFLGLQGGDRGQIDVEGGDWFVVFFGDVGVEIWEGVDWSIGGHDDIGSCKKVLEDVWFVYFLKHFIVTLDFIHVFQLQFAFSLSLLKLLLFTLGVFPFFLGLLSMLICCFFIGIDDNFSIDDLSLSVVFIVEGGNGVIDDALGISCELFFEIDVEFGEGGVCCFSALHEDLLCYLQSVVGVELRIGGEDVVCVLLKSDNLVDYISIILRASNWANYSFIF